MKRAILLGAVVAALAACERRAERAAESAPAPAPAPAVVPSPPVPAEVRTAAEEGRYTPLEGCRLLRVDKDGTGFSEELCPGLGGYALKRNESDGRQEVFVIAPGGRETGLQLTRFIGAGFSNLGTRAEWRGEPPSAVIIRYAVVEDPGQPQRSTSYLAVARLTGPGGPCVTARVAPGPDQNAAARRLADAAGPCLESGS